MEKARKNKSLQAIANIFSFVLVFAFIAQPLIVLAAPTQTGTSSTIVGCPTGKDCAVYSRNDSFGNWDPTSVLSGGVGYGGSAGVRSVCETSAQICREEGYEDVVCDPSAWSKAEWYSPSDNFQRDYTNGAWTTYGAWGGNDEYWTKITCQKPSVPVVVDVCPNIDGAQDTVPAGYTVDGSGNCVIPTPVDAAPIGFLDSASCSVFNGWTYDPDEPSVSNVVHFYADGPAGSGTFIGAMNVDQPRPDINTAYGVAGNHGFSFATPLSLKDGGTHDIYAYGINTNPANPDANNSVLPQAWNNLINHRTISGCVVSTTPAPTISSLVTNTNTVVSGSSVTLSWASSDATSCTASGGWSGAQTTSGSQVIGPLTATATTTVTFNLSCTSSVGTATQSTTISVVPGSIAPASSVSVSISGIPASLTIPTSGSASVAITSTATVSDSSPLTQHGIEKRLDGGAWTNAGAWNNPIANQARTTDASFTGLTLSVAGTYDFRTYASIDGGATYTYSSIVSMPATTAGTTTAPSFTTALTANPTALSSGATSTLSWATAGATSCTASGGWSGAQTTSGTAVVGPITADTTYMLTCTGPGGSTPSSTTVTFSAPPGPTAPTFTTPLSINPTTITSGSSATLSWASSNASSCTASGSWSGPVGLSGSQTVGPFTVTATTTETFDIACTNSVGTTNGSAVLTVNPAGAGVTATGTVSVSFAAGLTTSENGATAPFTVVLDAAPLASVLIPIQSSDFTEGTTSATLLTFTPSNWNVPQTVIVTGINDTIIDGDVAYAVLVGPITSVDINWNGVDPQDVSLTNIDNDSGTVSTTTPSVASFSVSPATLSSGSSATLSWSSTNATLCVAGNAWSGNQAVSGSQTVGPFTVSTQTAYVFDISCGNGVSTSTASTTLTVNPPAPVTFSSTSGRGGGGGGSGPCVGYGCPATGGPTVSPEIWILIDTVSSGGVATSPAKVCKYDDFLTSFMKRGISNDPNEVRKLQYFLNTYEAANLPVNGEFDLSTEEAVKAFQVKNTESVLLPWGTTTPTGIVYITTTAEINRIFCGDYPEYRDGDLKDIIGPNVLYTPTDNTSQFEGVVGLNSSSSTSTAPVSPNIAGVIGSISGKMLDLLGKVPWYPVLILILVLLGSGLVVHSILIKDIASGVAIMSLMRGASLLGAGTLLNAMNTLAYMLDPEWFISHLGLGLSWLLGLDLINLLLFAFLCVFLIAIFLGQSMKKTVNLS